jgi:uncharacterized protein (TIGR02594 family)
MSAAALPTLYCPADFSQFPWMEHAWNELGTREVRGSRHNARIIEYLRSINASLSSDEIAWCSAFVNWCMEQAGITGTDRANARSWLDWGGQCVAPVYGAVCVLWRESRQSWKGHVGFYLGKEGSQLILLGGNQNNSVSIKEYHESRLLGFRWPSGFPLPSGTS